MPCAFAKSVSITEEMITQEEEEGTEDFREKTAGIRIQSLIPGIEVVLKIIKHYQEEGQGSEVVQGVFLGLVVDDHLEITNCFTFPQHTDDDADFDEVQYQVGMLRSLHHANIDHLHVGWYQSTYYGSFLSRALLDSQFSYQHTIEETVVLISDPIKTAQGSLSLEAYRLTPKLTEICKEKDCSPESIHLEKSLQRLMDRIDAMSQEIVTYNIYCRNLSKQQQKHQYLQRRPQETDGATESRRTAAAAGGGHRQDVQTPTASSARGHTSHRRTNQQLLSERERIYRSEPRQALHGRGATGGQQLKSRTEEGTARRRTRGSSGHCQNTSQSQM